MPLEATLGNSVGGTEVVVRTAHLYEAVSSLDVTKGSLRTRESPVIEAFRGTKKHVGK